MPLNKTLSKEFMHRSKLRKNYYKNATYENKDLYKKQRNYCVGLLKREKKNYYNSLEVYEDCSKFWRSVNPLFSDKQNVKNRNIIIVENDTIISNKKDVTEKLNN